jgi:S-adenosylmethionine:tRNA ribosyltransferase-isomerase
MVEKTSETVALPRVVVADYTYELPEERIAQHPLTQRDQARLLVFEPGQCIQHRHFYDLPELLPPDAVLVGNDSRVIAARLLLRRAPASGPSPSDSLQRAGLVEVLCLEPRYPSTDPSVALTCTEPPVIWSCFLGGKRIRPRQTLHGAQLQGQVLERNGQEGLVRFEWAQEAVPVSFGELLEREGRTPLPPYLNRPDTNRDRIEYQTVFARQAGSVAAPTAGLHFSTEMLQRHFKDRFVRFTLHVGAGTFAPVKVETVAEHTMHRERIVVHRDQLERLIEALDQSRPLVAIGTTTMRTLESLYWFGVSLQGTASEAARVTHLDPPDTHISFQVSQWEPYFGSTDIPAVHALRAVLAHMDREDVSFLHGYTSLIIIPGYSFRVVDALVTNFHQPRSTLLMLVAAFLPGGRDTLLQIYHEALAQQYRFLSYGDASLLWRRRPTDSSAKHHEDSVQNSAAT